MDQALANRVVFVTGGASGIGRKCARAYAREGARVNGSKALGIAFDKIEVQPGDSALPKASGIGRIDECRKCLPCRRVDPVVLLTHRVRKRTDLETARRDNALESAFTRGLFVD